ncbi:MAG: mannose-1-phosphate guanylyltransferase [Bacteroidales bacterium]|nr:mannose-1-phosphate guanylyltransferase [Bacteroidales bacterium]MBR2134737.1 mannose-1-phosphate guanylyltransferase [Bacteroidales bacterium]
MVSNKYCIIMAGGVGSRFWPVSRYAHPKQFLDILGTGRSFLQTTVDRFKRIVPVENILIVSAKQYEGLIAQQVPEIPKDNVLLENRKRNTAPCIAYATYKLYKKDPSATVVVTPADHLILNEDVFLETVETVLNHACTSDALFTLGIKPTRPETQYGYIQANKAKAEIVSGHASYQVKTFTEKPDLEMAKVLFSSGEFLWNSGIFIWNLKTIKKEMETHIPDIAASFADIAEYYYTDREQEKVDEVYDACASISIDYGVMEKTSMCRVFEASFGWSDLGTWESLYAQGPKNEDGNMVNTEKVMLNGVKNSIIVSAEKDKLMVVKGLENFIVISTSDVLLVCPRDEKQIKAVTADLAINNFGEYM